MAHVCVRVHGCVHLSACMRMRVCVSVFMHLCLCVSKGVYAVHCRAHFPLLQCVYVYSCEIGSVYVYTYTYSAVIPPFTNVHFIICA